jgi:hypothetical protein
MDHENGYGEAGGGAFIAPPLWPKVIGFICIGFAGLGLCCGGVGVAVMPFMSGMMSSQMNGDPLPPTMRFGAIDYAVTAAGLALSVLLLFGGIFLVGRRPIGRLFVLVYSVPAMGVSIFQIVHGFSKQAATEQWAIDYPNNPMAQQINSGNPMQQIGPLIGMVFGLVLGVGFPLFLFVWFAAIKTKPEQITGTEEGVY